MISLMFLCFPLYLIAQITAILRLRRIWRWVSLAPALPMTFVVAATIKAWIDQSNLWPLLLLFASPAALVYVLAIIGLHRLFGTRS